MDRDPTRVRGSVACLLLHLLMAGCAGAPAPGHPVVEQMGQLLLVGFEGSATEGNAELERLLCEVRVGGVVLFEAPTSGIRRSLPR